MKKILSFLLCTTLIVTCLCGCKSKNSTGETLYVFNWTEYMPQEVYDLFEEETGIHVVENTFSSNEEMLTKLVAGGSEQYDLVVASNYVLEAMKNKNLIQKIDTSKLENLGNIKSAFLGRDFDKNNEYSVPYMATATLIAYNKKTCKDLGVEIKSYNDLLNPKLENNIVAVDDCRELLDMALKANGLDPDTTDKKTVDSTLDWLKKFDKNVKLYDNDTAFSALATNECAVGLVYNLDAALAINENPDIDVLYTDEPCELAIDSFVLTKSSAHSEAALKFIDFIMRPDVYAKCLEAFPAVCLNSEAEKEMDKSFFENSAVSIPDKELERAHLTKEIGEATVYYDDVYTKMKNG